MQTLLKLKTCSRYFCSVSEIYVKIRVFQKKDQSHSLSITEIINCETGTYLNVQNTMFHETLRQITC